MMAISLCGILLIATPAYLGYNNGKLQRELTLAHTNVVELSQQFEDWEKDKAFHWKMIGNAAQRTSKSQADFREFSEEWIQRLFDDMERLKRLNEDVWGAEGLRDFPDMETLNTFLIKDDTDKLEWTMQGAWVCTDFALQLSKNAAKEGYRLHFSQVIAHQGNHITSLHMMNMAIVEKFIPGYGVGKFVIMIEPQTDEWYIFGQIVDDRVEYDREKWYPFLP